MFRVSSLLTVLTVAAATVSAQASGVTFDGTATGAAPAGWTLGHTGRGQSKWTVIADPTAPSKSKVLQQNGVATYPVALLDSAQIKDGCIEVKFKAISGKEDRAAGLVWRATDLNNYYVVRANALEDNVVLYKTVGGSRLSLTTTQGAAYGVKAPVPPNAWHTLRVEFKGPNFKVIYNGTPLFEVNDTTFAGAGKVGLWTKADSATLFDQFTVDCK